MLRGTFQMMKSVNKSLTLNKIRKDGPISRAEIAKETKLTPPTVSAMVRELIDEGIVEESKLGKSHGGRKPTMLKINSEKFNIIGVDAGPERIEAVLANLSGEIIIKESFSLDSVINNEKFLEVMIRVVESVLSKNASGSTFLGIGVAMHGVVDVKEGVSLNAPILGLSQIPIKEKLESHFKVEVYVENDARAMALGESWFGNYENIKSMMTVNIGNGVGAGLVIDGKLYHGSQDIAGEIGHMTIDINGEMCECGNQGCLQTLITGPSISKKANSIQSINTYKDGESVYKDAMSGDIKLTELFIEIGEVIGIGLTNVIHVANPGLIILGGGVSKAESLFLQKTIETIKNRALTDEAKKTPVVITTLGDDSTLLGAVALIQEKIFQ